MVDMNVLDAIERAKNNSDIKKLKDFFLGSAFTCVKDGEEINQWTILFYNPKTKRVTDCFVNDRFVTPSEETKAIDEIKELNTKNIKVPVEKALEIAKKDITKTIINILISLHKKDVVMWSIGLVSSDMTATSVDINAETGEVIKKEETKLIKQL